MTANQERVVLTALSRAAELRGATFAEGKAIHACQRYPNRAHVAEVRRFCTYWLWGNGVRRELMDVGDEWTQWLADAPGPRAHAPHHNGNG